MKSVTRFLARLVIVATALFLLAVMREVVPTLTQYGLHDLFREDVPVSFTMLLAFVISAVSIMPSVLIVHYGFRATR